MSQGHHHGHEAGHGGHGLDPSLQGHHHEPGFWRKYVFSVDHKVIGIQYAITAMCFLLLGFFMMLVMRWQLAMPEERVPLVGGLLARLGISDPAKGFLTPDGYNMLGAMHGTIMVFLGVVPLAVGGFGNYVMPLQIGARDMAFPRLNMMSYWVYLAGGVVMIASFWANGGAAQSGWTSYPPLANIALTGQTYWLIGMVLLITSSLLGSVNFLTTIIHLRSPGLTFWRLPFFVHSQFVTALLLLLAFPPLEAAGILQLMDRVAGTSFFMPAGLWINSKVADYSGGGNPLLWQHLFWFLAHPEVYVLILPAMGIVGEIIANNTRKPLWGYNTLVYAINFLGFMSFIVWAHHMYMTGMGTTLSTFFQATTMIISIPSVVILTCFIISLYGARIRYNVPMLFALTFLPMFAIGGLTGLPLGLAASDIYLHDTYYVIGHFHYVVAPGTVIALFAGIYYWFPKATGRRMNDLLGHLHFWPSFVGMNLVFAPMFFVGIAGVNRRLWSQTDYNLGQLTQNWVVLSSIGAAVLALGQLPFIVNFFWSMFAGQKVSANVWEATTLEWAAAPSPPPHGNFLREPVVYCGPYEYSVPGKKSDFCPQCQPLEA